MESGPEARTRQEEATGEVRTLREGTTGIRKTVGFATTKGQDYEVALCSLIFLRALRITSDFFIVCNHASYDKFDDVVLFYRLEGDPGHEYSAILLQAKHRDKYTEKKLTKSNPFNLKDYLDSFNKIRNLWEQPVKVGSCELKFKDITLVLYTNTGCDIGEAAVDVTDLPEVQHLKDFLNTGRGRLLKISEAQGVGLPRGPDTSDFLGHLILCTEQMSVKTADKILEEELCKVLGLTSNDVAGKLNFELKHVVKAWWSEEEIGRYLTAESEEWKTILQMQVKSINSDTIIIDNQLNLDFTVAALQEFDFVHHRMKMTWIPVRDKYQATATRVRLFRAQRNSLVLDTKYLEDHWAEVGALWGKIVCPTLVLDMSNNSLDEESQLLQNVQVAVQSGAGRHLVVIAKEQPQGDGWNIVEPLTTWSALDEGTQERLLSVNVKLQGSTVALRDIVRFVMTNIMNDEVIILISVCQTEIKVGEVMPAPLGYYVPRCLQRTSSKTINFDSLQSTNILIFSENVFCIRQFSERFKTVSPSDLKRTDTIEGELFVPGVSFNSEIQKLCCKFCVRGISGEIGTKGFTNDVTDFIPFTWICKEKVVVVEGLPGVGKSSLVTAMCSSVKQQFPEAWVLRVDMGRHTEFIKGRNFRNSSDIKDFLLQGLNKDLHSLERYLLEHSLTVTGNIFLFMDAFDEISPDFTTECCDLLKGITQMMMFRQMVVTTRPVTTKDVQEALEVEAFTLPVFCEEEQTIFLEKFSREKNVDERLISSLRQCAGQVIEVPLLCKMAAEVLLYHQEKSLLRCLDPWRRVLLYKLFVEQNINNRIAEKFGLDASLPGVKKLLESNQKQHLQNLQGLAVRKLMPVDKLSNLYVSFEMPEEKFGLVVNTGGTVAFEHQTFAEYFLGCWLSEHWWQCPPQLLRDVLLQDGFEFILATMSWMLFEGLPLHVAVAQGDEGSVRALLSLGTTDRGGRSPLHVAAMTQGKNREVWELLLASGEDPNKEDDVLVKGAVIYAEVTRNWEFVELMKENGATLEDLKFVTNLKAAKEVLIYTIKKGLTSLLKYILGMHKGIFDETFDAKDNTLLHIATVNNSIAVMKILIDMCHKINVRNKSGMTPFHEASRLGHLVALGLLIESGADLNLKNNYGETVLMEASREGHLSVVKFLIENGADRNVKNENGRTAITMAVNRGHLEVIKLLIESGANPNVKSDYGATALALVAREGRLEVVKLLIENGADPNISNEGGGTALTLAAHEGHLQVLKLLMGNGADPNVNSKYGETALTLAARAGRVEIVELLVEKGADPNKANEDGETALMLASSEGHLDIVKLLIENGADLNFMSNFGDTALTETVRRGHVIIMNYLLTCGAELTLQ